MPVWADDRLELVFLVLLVALTPAVTFRALPVAFPAAGAVATVPGVAVLLGVATVPGVAVLLGVATLLGVAVTAVESPLS